MQLTTLYKKTSTGKIQQWDCIVENDNYHTVTGQVLGKKIINVPTYCEGKNIGKANETSPAEQALREAQALWESKKKKGYVESLDKAKLGEVNTDFVTGGFNPMLAEKFRDHEHKINYPWYGQPKLDGHRGTLDKGVLYSRTRKPITSCVHIMKAAKELGLDIYALDGELYNHDYKDDFETLSSAIRKKDPLTPEMQKIVQYHIYDINNAQPYKLRYELLQMIFEKHIKGSPYEGLFQLVPLEKVVSKENAINREKYWRLDCGFEGFMLRNPDSLYQGRRTVDLQKVKVFQDAEFKIVDAEEGKGKFKGAVAAFICEIDDERGKRTFKAGMKNVTIDMQRAWHENPSIWMDKMATIEFLNYTRKNVVPRHGKFLRFRDTEY